MIKNLRPALAERGKIKIGDKGNVITSRGGKQFQPPIKLDHFRITTVERDEAGRLIEDKELTKKLKRDPQEKLLEIPIRLLYDSVELNCPTWYAAYKGHKLWCQGDGETAYRLDEKGTKRVEVKCPCEHLEPFYEGGAPCKPNAKLSVLIDGAERIGGVYTFRTTSHNSVTFLVSSLLMLRQITGGYLGGIPLVLVVGPKRAVVPKTGEVQTIYVVTVEFVGNEVALRKEAQKIGLERKTHAMIMSDMESEARKLLELLPPPEAEDQVSIAEEFYPEAVQAELAKEKKAAPDPFQDSPEVATAKAAGDEEALKRAREKESIEALKEGGPDYVHATEKEAPPADKPAEGCPPQCSAPGCEGSPAWAIGPRAPGDPPFFLCAECVNKIGGLLFSKPPVEHGKVTVGKGLEALRVTSMEFTPADLAKIREKIGLPAEPETTPPAQEAPAGDPGSGIKGHVCGKCKFEYPDDEPKCPECGTPRDKLF